MQLRIPSDASPLPDGWSAPELSSDVIEADGLRLQRVGVSSVGPSGAEVTGSAAGPGDTPPVDRAYFELLERVATVEAASHRDRVYPLLAASSEVIGEVRAEELFPQDPEPARWRHARSNGVALHDGWERAVERARWELAERDRVVGSWYGAVAPVPYLGPLPDELGLLTRHDWRAVRIPEPDEGRFSRDVEVVAVFGFPREPGLPLALGYGGRDSERGALETAAAEALQLLAFLWGEPPPPSSPPPGPSPMHHLDHFQYSGSHARARAWLEGSRRVGRHARSPAPASRMGFVDLTPPWLKPGLRVVKAFCQGSIPLTFGDSPFAAHLPPEERVHPIA